MANEYPEDFKCPISLEIMSDPVILSSGHTFDRTSIQRWLDSGHRTCPITKLPLPEHPSLIPNHALRSLISTFTPASKPHRTNQLHHPQALIAALTSPSSSADLKLESLDRLARLAKRDPALRSRLVDSGAAAAVLGCAALQEKALSLLLVLSLDDDAKVGLVAEGAVSRVVEALTSATALPSCRAVAATVLTSLAVVEVNRATIGAHPRAIAALVQLLAAGKGRERKEAATALFAVCSFPDNRRRAALCGAVPVLLRIASSGGLDRAVQVLGLLAKCREGRDEMERIDGCVRVLSGVLRTGTSRGVQYSLTALYSLCFYCERMRSEAKNEGVLETCLEFAEDDNEKIRSHAGSLIEILGGNHSTM